MDDFLGVNGRLFSKNGRKIVHIAQRPPSETLFWGMVPLTHHEATERVVGEVGLIVVMGRMAFNGKKWGEDSGVMEAFRYLCG